MNLCIRGVCFVLLSPSHCGSLRYISDIQRIFANPLHSSSHLGSLSFSGPQGTKPCCIVHPGWFPFYHATPVGQAKNPGPFSQIRMVVTNPTAVYKRISELLGFQAHLIALSETAATLPVQQAVSSDLRKHHYKTFWSPPVHSLRETSMPSFRGAALGTLITTCLPSRILRANIPKPLLDSQRFCAAVVTLGTVEVLVISLYGFAKKTENGKKLNDILLGYVCQLIQDIHIPYLVCGDFNEPVCDLPVYQFFANSGGVEAHAYHRHAFGFSLEPTCAGSTYNDTIIFHPLLARHVRAMKVDHDFAINVHSPLFVDFDFTEPVCPTVKIRSPQSWAPFSPPQDLIEEAYQQANCDDSLHCGPFDSADDANHALCMWSKRVECAVHKALHKNHLSNPDVNLTDGLHDRYRGRGAPIKPVHVQQPSGVKPDRHNGYTPECEVFFHYEQI